MRLLIALLCLLPLSAGAFWQSRLQVSVGSAPTYQGPGDLVSGATVWVGLRAYSQAVAATGTQKSVNVRRVTDNVACDILIATNGGLGLTTATCNSSTQGGLTPQAFAGTDAAGTGAIAGTTLTMTATLHIGDQITGGTAALGTYIVSGTSPIWTVNISQTVASATLTAMVGLAVPTIYDQSGNSRDAAQGTAANQPFLLVNVLNGGTLPTIGTTASASQYLQATIPSLSQPWSMASVSERTGAFTVFADFMSTYSSPGGAVIQFTNVANEANLYAGTATTPVTAADSAAHSFQGVFNGTGNACIIVVDGTAATGLNCGTAVSQTAFKFSGDQFNGVTGFTSQGGAWPIGLSATNYGNFHTNDSAYYGTP